MFFVIQEIVNYDLLVKITHLWYEKGSDSIVKIDLINFLSRNTTKNCEWVLTITGVAWPDFFDCGPFSLSAALLEYTDFIITSSANQNQIFCIFFFNLTFLDTFRCLLGKFLNSNNRASGRKKKLRASIWPCLHYYLTKFILKICNLGPCVPL